MFNLSGLLAVALLSPSIDEARTRRVFIGAASLIVLVSGVYFGNMRYGHQLTGKPLRGNWPQAEISQTLEREWRAQTGDAPLRVIVGDVWTGGMVGMNGRPPPTVLINGDYSISPWITPDQVARDGALLVWSGAEPASLAFFAHDLEQRELQFYAPGARREKASPVTVHYAIIPPGASARTPLRPEPTP
jgi:hypothetical protein